MLFRTTKNETENFQFFFEELLKNPTHHIFHEILNFFDKNVEIKKRKKTNGKTKFRNCPITIKKRKKKNFFSIEKQEKHQKKILTKEL